LGFVLALAGAVLVVLKKPRTEPGFGSDSNFNRLSAMLV